MTLRWGLSLKDQIKPERLIEECVSRYFPEGKRQINAEIRKLKEILQHKYSR